MRLRAAKLDALVSRCERTGLQLDTALRSIMLGPAAGWQARGLAAKMLSIAGDNCAANLMDLFFAQTEEIELWETGLTIEYFGSRAVVRRLTDALHDANPHRRHAAARALGWIPNDGRRAAKALVGVIADKSQPQPVREQAAESLASLGYAPAVPTLIDLLDELDVRMRFWAVFALGGIAQSRMFDHPWRRADRRVVEALEKMLADNEAPPGNWWPVGKEALAMLAHLEPRYREELDPETQRVLRDPNFSPDDIRWAEFYGVSKPKNTRHF